MSRAIEIAGFTNTGDLMRWRKQTSPNIRLAALGCALGLIGCAQQAVEPALNSRPISLSVSSVVLYRGATSTVAITVDMQPFGIALSVAGLPAGVTANLTPAFLQSTDSTSTLKLSADASTPLVERRITIVATPNRETAAPTAAVLDVRVSECPGYAIPDQCPPFQTGGSNAISGIVLERMVSGVVPVSGARIWAWVQLANGSGYSAGSVLADTEGKYFFPNLPNALIVLEARNQVYDQPCATIVNLSSAAATADIELVSSERPILQDSPPSPAIRGMVYEVSPAGRHPVAGARVFFEFLLETVAATMTTDENGFYHLCRLPAGSAWVTPVKAGYITTGRPVTVNGVIEMDLEMKRQ
jgi:hypothetical protein